MSQTIAVDFDGVIHDYTKGWQDGSIYGEPVAGSLEAIELLLETYSVFIFTSRKPHQVVEWLQKHLSCPIIAGAPEFWNEQGQLLVTSKKLPALIYIDDRGYRFQSWGSTMAFLGQWLPVFSRMENNAK